MALTAVVVSILLNQLINLCLSYLGYLLVRNRDNELFESDEFAIIYQVEKEFTVYVEVKDCI